MAVKGASLPNTYSVTSVLLKTVQHDNNKSSLDYIAFGMPQMVEVRIPILLGTFLHVTICLLFLKTLPCAQPHLLSPFPILKTIDFIILLFQFYKSLFVSSYFVLNRIFSSEKCEINLIA